MEVSDNPFQRFITLSIHALNESEIDYVMIGGVQRFVRFCCYGLKILLLVPFFALFRHSCEPQQFVPTDSVYQ